MEFIAPKSAHYLHRLSHADNHVHFVDGAAGGYAMAARQMKIHLATFKDFQSAA